MSAVTWLTLYSVTPLLLKISSPGSDTELRCCVSSPDSVVLHVVGVACVLGVTAGFTQLPGLSSQQEIIPSGFRSRALLSTTDGSAIRVRPIYYSVSGLREENKLHPCVSPPDVTRVCLSITSDFYAKGDHWFLHRLGVFHALPLL